MSSPVGNSTIPAELFVKLKTAFYVSHVDAVLTALVGDYSGYFYHQLQR